MNLDPTIMKNKSTKIGALILTSLILASNAFAQDFDKFKALLVYKVSEYVLWPTDQEYRTIGLYKDASIYRELTQFADSRTGIKIVHLDKPEDVSKCDIIFVCEGHKNEINNFVKNIEDQSILVISETKDHYTNGADLVFFIEDDKLRFAVNDTKISGKGMSASRKLTALAQDL